MALVDVLTMLWSIGEIYLKWHTSLLQWNALFTRPQINLRARIVYLIIPSVTAFACIHMTLESKKQHSTCVRVLGLCQITEYSNIRSMVRIFDRWFKYPVGIFRFEYSNKKCSFHNNNFEFVFSYCYFPHHPHYHVAQLPIGGLRISNIRSKSKSKSKYPVTILFENAQP